MFRSGFTCAFRSREGDQCDVSGQEGYAPVDKLISSMFTLAGLLVAATTTLATVKEEARQRKHRGETSRNGRCKRRTLRAWDAFLSKQVVKRHKMESCNGDKAHQRVSINENNSMSKACRPSL